MIDGKLVAKNIHLARQSEKAVALSSDEVAALSSYVSMLEKQLLKYMAHLARESVDNAERHNTVVIEDLVRDIEVALEGIKQRMAPHG